MTDKLNINSRVKRYLFIGVTVYALEIIIILIAQKAGTGPVLAVALSFWIGLALSFGLQKFVTFGDRRLHHRILLPQLAAYCGLVLFNFGFTVLMTGLLQNWLPAAIVRTLALGITTLWNFYLYRTRIFNNPDEPVIY